jgi:hypothetical protein
MVLIHKIALETSFTIHHISVTKGANKNNIFHQIKAEYFKLLSFCLYHKNNAQNDIISEYHTNK